jgi:predicted nuclease of predicted toxin-antitoxin system
MRFLVDEDLPRSADSLLRKFGHDCFDARDVGLRGAKDPVVAAWAKSKGTGILTGDTDFLDVRKYPPADYAGIVVLRIPSWATATFILRMIESFLTREDLVAQVPGKLAIVSPGRVRLRSGLPQHADR